MLEVKGLIARVVGGRWAHEMVCERNHANIVNVSAAIVNFTVVFTDDVWQSIKLDLTGRRHCRRH